MNRAARLQSARHWLPTYRGRDLLRGYARWYGVDLVCAIVELRLLGVPVAEERERRVLLSVAERAKIRAERSQHRDRAEATPWPFECDDRHAFIAGYTSAGFAYGITCEDWERLEKVLPRDADEQ